MTEQPSAEDAFALAEDIRAVLVRYVARDDAHPDVVHCGLTIAIGDWIHADCRAHGTPEPRAVVYLLQSVADYLTARENDRDEAAAATKH